MTAAPVSSVVVGTAPGHDALTAMPPSVSPGDTSATILSLLVEVLGDDAAALTLRGSLSRVALSDSSVRTLLALAAARSGDERPTPMLIEAECAAGRFRQDLLFRLSAGVVQLPPLRHRPREIPILARLFLVAIKFNRVKTRHTLGSSAYSNTVGVVVR
jgi:hypothetical protein